ncbi:MAG TPA: putative toxin-antitoxin system toxin component, PIN family [Steroidobacteraceae bacterium]|nr:putative toxin-antitoxin system toxin component, PIN family [Steroidobacteraceae bacterium]
MRIVVDTNTAISGLLWQGQPRQIVDLIRARTHSLCVSMALLAELAEVIARPKFAQRIQAAGLSAAALVQDYTRLAEIVEPAPLAKPVSRDPDDDVVLATALAARQPYRLRRSGPARRWLLRRCPHPQRR